MRRKKLENTPSHCSKACGLRIAARHDDHIAGLDLPARTSHCGVEIENLELLQAVSHGFDRFGIPGRCVHHDRALPQLRLDLLQNSKHDIGGRQTQDGAAACGSHLAGVRAAFPSQG
ncbi:MAG: hypothetical protein O2795_18125 [Acidobacteria bacterium]|nr:hypothetical protein [Acidobacteriota bacterium]